MRLKVSARLYVRIILFTTIFYLRVFIEEDFIPIQLMAILDNFEKRPYVKTKGLMLI